LFLSGINLQHKKYVIKFIYFLGLAQSFWTSIDDEGIMMKNPYDHLALLYGEDQAPGLVQRVQKLIQDYQGRIPTRRSELSERDALLITYGDQVQASGEKPLQTLNTFCSRHLNGIVGGIHILPFYPWTSDDGFSVVDYRQVDPNLGTWEDVSALGDRFRLMFDGVINHISAESEWFKAFLQDDPHYQDYFITVAGKPDLSQVVRPRTLPLLTLFTTPSGQKQVWTTFSADQIDLNYRNPEVLLEIPISC
jgi:sucrose phosphorylase